MGTSKTNVRCNAHVDGTFFNDLLAILPGHVYWKDEAGCYLGCNNEFARTLNLKSREDIVGKIDFDFLDAKSAQKIYDDDQAIMAQGIPRTLEEQATFANHVRCKYYLSKKAPLHDLKGSVIGVVGISIDITANKAYEEKIKQKIIAVAQRQIAHRLSPYSFELLELDHIIAAMPGHVYWQDRKGHYLGANKSFLDYLGLDARDDIMGKTVYDFASLNIADTITKTDKKVMLYNKPYIFEEPAINQEPLKLTCLNHKTPICNKRNEVIGLLCISLYSNEQKHIQEQQFRVAISNQQTEAIALQRNTAYLEKIIDTLPANVYWKNRDNCYLGANKTNLNAFNHGSSTNIVGKTLYELLPKEMAEKHHHIDSEVMDTDKAISVEEVGFNQTGKLTIYHSKKVPMHNERGEVIGMVGISFDMTKERQAQAERQRLEMAKAQAEYVNDLKTEFIMNMSHDIRTPFSAILGFADLLYRNETDATKKDQLGLILNSSKKMMDLLDEILHSLKSSDPQALGQNKQVTFTLAEVMTNVLDVLEPSIKIKQLALKKHMARIAGNRVKGYRFKLERILLNLISNAIKFTHQGEISLTVKKIAAKANTMTVQIIVADTGLGIPAEEINGIFKHFHRGESNYEGPGLGLAIVKQFVEEMGGNIVVTSKLNKGTIFTITLTLDLVSIAIDQTKREIIQDDTTTQHKTAGPSVLLVEDDLTSQKLAVALLADVGLHVDLATTGNKALALCQKYTYNLIIMDLGLPDMDGIEVSRRIKNLANHADTPIVGLTAKLVEEQQQPTPDSPLAKLYIKPLTAEICRSLVRKMMLPFHQ